MCLLAILWQRHPRYRLVLAANRDEFHAREAAPAAPWADAPQLLAGRDLQAGGTWLGLSRDRRFGVITNYRELDRPRSDAPSRGGLIPSYLSAATAPADYLRTLEADAAAYAGFSLLIGDRDSLWLASNRGGAFATPLAPGLYGLSNHALDTPWPKLLRLRRQVEVWAGSKTDPAADAETLLRMLDDRRREAHATTSTSGLGADWDHALSSPFVEHPQYGTRCSTVLLIEHDGAVQLCERRFAASGAASGCNEWQLNAHEWPDAHGNRSPPAGL